MIKTILNIDVPEIAPAVEFYTSALGFRLARIIEGDVAELSGGSSTIYLLANRAASVSVTSPRILRDYSRHWTPVHIDFVVDDLLTATAQAIRAGAVKEGDCVDWRGSRCISFSDPFGHGFCLIEFDKESYSDGAV